MYKKVGDIAEAEIIYLKTLLKLAKWKDVIGESADFKTWFKNVELSDFPDYSRCFFILIPPGGKVHRHTDTRRVGKSYHIPVTTNQDCINNMYPGGPLHLLVGGIYEVDRQIEHDSCNNGITDRVHLLVER